MLSTEIIYQSLAVGLTVIGSLGNALGYVWQKKGHLSHIEQNEIREIQDEETQSLLKNKIWLTGFIVCLLGSILTASAFKFGPQSLLAPLSALVLVFNAILATKILNEPFTRQNLYGIALVVIGSVIAVIFGPKSNTDNVTLSYIEACWRNPVFEIFFIGVTLLFLIDYILVRVFEKKNAKSIALSHTIVYGANFLMVSYIGIAAYFGSVNVLFMKSLMIIIGSFQFSYLSNYLFYITAIGLIIVNVLLEFFRQRAIKYFDASYVVPIFQVLLILGAATMGAIFFDEFKNLSLKDLILFCIAIFITLIGVAILAFGLGSIYSKMKKLAKESAISLGLIRHEKTDSLRTKARKHFVKRTQRTRQVIEPQPFAVWSGLTTYLGHEYYAESQSLLFPPEIDIEHISAALQDVPEDYQTFVE
eukprot:516646_1